MGLRGDTLQTTEVAAPAFSGADETDRLIGAYLAHAPVSLALRELNRLAALQILLRKHGMLPIGDVLDVGCGDGFWWTLVEPKPKAVFGVDIQEREISQAARVIEAKVCDISRQADPFGRDFDLLIGNCSFEHIRNIDGALAHCAERLRPDGHFVLFVPTPGWAFQGLLQGFLLKRFPRLAMMLSGAMNGFFQHWHMYDPPLWQAVLERNGLETVDLVGLGNPKSEFLFRLFLPTGFLAFLFKSVFRVYPNRILPFLGLPARRWARRALEEPIVAASSPHAYEYAIVCRRKAQA